MLSKHIVSGFNTLMTSNGHVMKVCNVQLLLFVGLVSNVDQLTAVCINNGTGVSRLRQTNKISSDGT